MAKRNLNGMGSIRKRKDGRYEGRYTGTDGKQHSVFDYSPDKCAAALRAVTHEVDTGAWLEPSNMTVAEWLAIWIADYQGHTTGRTVETYQAVINRHFLPLFGGVKLSSFSAAHVWRMVSGMSKRGLSPSTIKHARGILSAAMKCAVEAGLIKDNPVASVKPPRMSKKAFTIIDREQIPAFIEAAQETRIPNALVFMLMTGIRAGEMRGLKWSDIDGDTMHIDRQLHAMSRNNRRFGPPKDGEKRTVQLSPPAVELLKAQRRAQLEDKLAAGTGWIDDQITTGLVFRQKDGFNLDEGILHYAVEKVKTALGLPGLRPHDLRHSYAVAALRSGIDVKTVQHNLGHKYASITLDTYAAYTDDAGKTGAKKFGEYWANAIGGQNN